MRTRTVLGLGAAICGAVSLVPAAAGAATIAVTTTADSVANDELCSVREAVTSANNNVPVNDAGPDEPDCTVGEQGAEDTIQLTAATYTLGIAGSGNDNNQTGDLDVEVDSLSGGLTIDGQGSGQTEIDGADLDRLIHVVVGPGTLTLQDLRLDNGTAPAGESGGALFNNQANATNVAMSDVRVSNSFSPVSGGGIYWPSAGTLSLTNGSRVDGNSVTFPGIGPLGGGILLGLNSTLNLTDSTVTANTATDSSAGVGSTVSGGGITASNSTLNVTRSTISNNTLAVPGNAVDFPDGGGVFAQNSAVTVVDSTISGNSVTGGNIRGGGGLYHFDSTNTVDKLLTIQNSTFSGNSVSAAASSNGGAIQINGGNSTITASTFSGNTAASGAADAIYARDGGQSVESLQLRSSIFNEGTNGCAYPNPPGMGVSTGYNLETDDTCWAVNATGDQQNTAVSLGALASNGGSTQTHELQSGSNGLDDVPNADCDEADGDPLPADQRGVPRPQGAACDVGAYELGPTCNGLGSTVVGTGAGETITGTSGADVIVAGGGGDTVNAGDGSDTVCAGDGDDTVRPGTGNDPDVVFGEGDTDTVSFSDLTAGLTSANLATGTTAGTDSNVDTLATFENLTGSPFNDQSGSTGLTGNAGQNTIDGGNGNDIIQGLGDNDTLIGGGGTDTATWISLGPVDASLASGTATGGQGTDSLSGFENLTGSPVADTLTGDDSANTLIGFTGSSTFDGRGGADTMQGDNSATADTVVYSNQPGPVTVNLTTGAASGAQGADSITGGNVENVVGSPDNDTITGSGLANTLSGGGGFDTLIDGSALNGVSNVDTFNGGDGSDTVSYAAKGGAEPVTVNLNNTTGQGETGENDTIAADVESATGGSGDDTLTSDENPNLLTGGPGTDTVRFDGLNQAVSGSLQSTFQGQGTDGAIGIENIVGSAQGDTLRGDTAANTILAGTGADTLEGDGGTDILDGQGQTDTVSYAYLAGGAEIDLGNDSGFAGGGDTDTVPNVENAIGGAGSDIFFDGPVEDNAYNGAGDADFVNYQSAAATMTVNLATGVATGAGTDQLSAVENVEGSPQGDTITGDGAANNLRGLGGADTITGGLGSDDVFGGAGADDLLIRDLLADDADCGPADAATDTVTADDAATDTLTNCEADTVAFGPAPGSNPAGTQTGTPEAATTATRKCRKGSKLKKVKTKSGKVKRKCVKKRKKRA